MAVLDKSKRISNKEITATRKLLPQQVGRRFLIAQQGSIRMKNSIEGFSQQYAITLKKLVKKNASETKEIRIDCTDLVLLRWFVDFFPKMDKEIINGVEYAWCSYDKCMNDLPILSISKQGYADRMHKLVEFGLLEFVCLPQKGNKCYWRFGENYGHLIEGYRVQTPEGIVVEHQRVSCSNTRGYSSQTPDIDKSITDTSIKDISIRDIVDLFNTTCVSFPKVTAVSADRKKHISARLKQYGIETIKLVFEKAQASDFLKGNNQRKWKANFDWLLNETNFAKVLDGNYDDKHGNGAGGDTGDSLKPATGQNINYDNYRRTGV